MGAFLFVGQVPPIHANEINSSCQIDPFSADLLGLRRDAQECAPAASCTLKCRLAPRLEPSP
jgi:hypothetical protein